MADVFVSYAKADRPLALKLAAMLEAEGWKVWWDTSLAIGDDFRNEIMTELGLARAVVVIWTEASIKSDWVRSEAGRAQADRKLIPVKLPHLSYKDLPPPFDVLHTENVGQEDKIKAAVVAQLAKPAVQPSAAALLTKGFKYELLTWVGIGGGALTLFGSFDAVLKLAGWARVLVQHWKEWTHAFWLWAFSCLGIHLPPEWTPILSFLLFWSLLFMGQAIKYKSVIIIQPIEGKSFDAASWNLVYYLALILGFMLLTKTLVIPLVGVFASTHDPYYVILAGILLAIAPLLLIVLFARYRLHALVSAALMLTFFTIITLTQLDLKFGIKFLPESTAAILLVLAVVAWLSPLMLLSVAPAKVVSRRLIFLALGLLLLIALNELSKLGIDLTALKHQG